MLSGPFFMAAIFYSVGGEVIVTTRAEFRVEQGIHFVYGARVTGREVEDIAVAVCCFGK